MLLMVAVLRRSCNYLTEYNACHQMVMHVKMLIWSIRYLVFHTYKQKGQSEHER